MAYIPPATSLDPYQYIGHTWDKGHIHGVKVKTEKIDAPGCILSQLLCRIVLSFIIHSRIFEQIDLSCC